MDGSDSGDGRKSAPPAEVRLESWKEIAAYLNRGTRTVIRWEQQEGLPVHRLQHDKRSSVYAYKTELDEWRKSRGALPEDGEPEAVPTSSRARFIRVLPLAGLAAVAALAAWFGWPQPKPPGRTRIVIADFENKTGDDAFDGALRQALLARITQSAWLRVEADERVQSTLSLMHRDPSSPLTGPLAREVCQRLGATAVVSGSIRKLGSQYAVGLDAAGCADGEQIASEYVEAAAKEQVVPALSQAVSRMRERLGESLASIRKPGAPAEVSTVSLAALKAYSVALHEKAVGADAVPFLERAIAFDPEFASAYFTLAQIHMNRGQPLEAEAAISRAYALRERTSERERLAIENYYHIVATGDLPQAVAAGRLAARLYPDDVAAQRAVFVASALSGDTETALRVAQADFRRSPDNGVAYSNLAIAMLGSGKPKEASQILERAREHGIGYDLFPFSRYIVAALEGNVAAMEHEAQLARSRPDAYDMLLLEVQAAGMFGQAEKARALAQYAAAQHRSAAPAMQATVALMEALFGSPQKAAAGAAQAVAASQDRRTSTAAALALALAGDSGKSEAVLGDLMRRYPRDTLLKNLWSPAIQSALALQRGDPRAAQQWSPGPPFAGAQGWPAYFGGLASLQLARPQEAAALFRRVIDTRGALLTSTFVYGAGPALPVAYLGLARSLWMAGKPRESRVAYEDLLSLWQRADPDLRLLAEARRELSALPK